MGLEQTIPESSFKLCLVCNKIGPVIEWVKKNPITNEETSKAKQCVSCWQEELNIEQKETK